MLTFKGVRFLFILCLPLMIINTELSQTNLVSQDQKSKDFRNRTENVFFLVFFLELGGKSSGAGVNFHAKLCTVGSTFNYCWLIRPLNLPCQCRRSQFLLNSAGESESLRARCKMHNILLGLAARQKVILFRKHVTRSRSTLIGVRLIDEVGGEVNIWREQNLSCGVHKFNKKLQYEWGCLKGCFRREVLGKVYEDAVSYLL